MTVKLLTEQLEFLSLTRGCTGSSESTLVKMLQCWKSHDAAQIITPISSFDMELSFDEKDKKVPHTLSGARREKFCPRGFR